MKLRRSDLLVLSLVVGSFALLYWRVLNKLVQDWAADDNYSHGFLIAPLAAYFAWERRDRLVAAARKPTTFGLGVIAVSLSLLVAGTLGAELFLTRISIVGMILGVVLFVWGAEHARILVFPVAFLLLMIPLPAIIFNQIAFPLQLIASRFGVMALEVARIPVLREGNVIVLSNTTLAVAEACSGIRSLLSLLSLGIVLGYFSDTRTWVRLLIAIATVPVAIVTNGARVAGTGIAAHFVGAEAATGFLHTFSGWLVFAIAFVMLLALARVLTALAPEVPVPNAAHAA